MEKRTTKGKSKLYESVTETIGDTPCIRINTLAPKHVNMYVKAEFFNPASSVKDRLAISIIENAEQKGLLKPGQTVVEATSGNTGIGLAMVCAARGYPLVVTMADSFSIERRKIMRYLGAKVVLTPRAEKGFGMYNKAKELAEKNGWFFAQQFETEANAEIHQNTTAQEILNDFSDVGLDYWVSGYGTGGTVSGVGRVLREKSPGTKIILTEPENAALIGSELKQERHSDNTPATSHSSWNPHLIQGWTGGAGSSPQQCPCHRGLTVPLTAVDSQLALDIFSPSSSYHPPTQCISCPLPHTHTCCCLLCTRSTFTCIPFSDSSNRAYLRVGLGVRVRGLVG